MKKLYLLASSFAVLSFAPSYAQDDINNNQPVVGRLNKTETRIQSKLTTDFNKGLLNSDQLCQFQRDFDGILDHENELQTGGGLNDSGKKKIENDLTAFEARLDKQAGLNTSKQAK